MMYTFINFSVFLLSHTDVSGGYSPSILNAQRLAVHTSKIVSFGKGKDYIPLTYKDAFSLATLGGAKGKAL